MSGIEGQRAVEILSLLEQERGLRLHLIRRFERGDEGAYEVEDSGGNRLVLKWRPWCRKAAEAAQVTACRLARMRDRGCPVPAEIASGRAGDVLFELQELAGGQPASEVTTDLVEQLIGVVQAQRGAGLGQGADWWDFLTDGLFRDRTSLCRPSILDGCTGPVAQLLQRLRRTALAAQPRQPVPNDVVHFDFGPANVLAQCGRLTAVLDWQSCRDGDAGYDLISMDWDLSAWPKATSEVSERLAREITRTTEPAAAAVYAAHTVLRNLTWSHRTEWEDHIVRTGHAFLDRWPAVKGTPATSR
ncbi:aminoglycoside phosphotransferase family protein [Nocardia transvalensis]|uniref:phosphotransferase n=1 Tax=Nocardia transvalensis TaxID=37333 RepID=UPI001895AB61|nr:aminoglycoside phosphotransferase family protein [Nocardia transvalensis]MBF6332976.1 aminoglycoside phosphotransferase family protein [Nocardia transvalensis]